MVVNAKDVIKRLKQYLGFTADNEVAEFLGVSKSTVSAWKQRNSVDVWLILDHCETIDLNWLLKGEDSETELTNRQQTNDNLLTTEIEMMKAQIASIEERIAGERRARVVHNVGSSGSTEIKQKSRIHVHD